MSGFFIDIGWHSLNKHGELLCGDHVEVIRQNDDSVVAVLADGLGSGVKANILSTLTAKIISTMVANRMGIKECVAAIAATLPVCEVRRIAYSTFTIIHVQKSAEAEIIQFDNPHAVFLRNGKYVEMPESAETLEGKTIYKSHMRLLENDTIIAMSDGAIHAGVGRTLNFGWQRHHVIEYMEGVYKKQCSAKALTTLLSDRCMDLYEGEPGDDTTVLTLKMLRRSQVNLLLGPPANPEDLRTMMSLFFSKEGKHVVCGGTTSTLAAEYLGKPLVVSKFAYASEHIPPTAKIEGVDLVTEGVITISRVLEYAKDYLEGNALYGEWSKGKDGASSVARILIEEATDINFYVGRAMNPAHQNPALPINFNIKMRLVEELTIALQTMGKHIKVSFF